MRTTFVESKAHPAVWRLIGGSHPVLELSKMKQRCAPRTPIYPTEFPGTGRAAQNRKQARDQIGRDVEKAVGELRKRPVWQSKHNIFNRYAPDLRALAGTALAKGRKGEGGVDRGKHRRRFSARLQGGRSFSHRRKSKCSWSVHAGAAGSWLGDR